MKIDTEKYVFEGGETNLGRFGMVKKGDVLELTSREAADIKDDKRFKKFVDEGKGNPKPKIDAGKLVKPAGFDKLSAEDQKKVVAKLIEAEEARLHEIDKQNGFSAKTNLREMKRDDLLEFVANVNKDGEKIKLLDGASKEEIIHAIEAHQTGQAGHDEAE